MGELAEKFDQKQIKSMLNTRFPNLNVILPLLPCYVYILGAVHRYYESRRRQYIDSKPERVAIKEHNDKKTKLKSRQKQVYSYMY